MVRDGRYLNEAEHNCIHFWKGALGDTATFLEFRRKCVMDWAKVIAVCFEWGILACMDKCLDFHERQICGWGLMYCLEDFVGVANWCIFGVGYTKFRQHNL